MLHTVLFDGFVIVAAIDLGLPAWLVALIALSGIAGGIYAMNRVKARLVQQPTGSAGSAGGGLSRSGVAMDQHLEPPIIRRDRGHHEQPGGPHRQVHHP